MVIAVNACNQTKNVDILPVVIFGLESAPREKARKDILGGENGMCRDTGT